MALKVLIIDDDASITNLLASLLSNQGMEVISSGNGAKGVELARAEKPDIIILDLILPGTIGWEVCKILRTFTSVPIAILSALDDPELISTALDAGADDYMTKPIASSVLVAHIKNLARRHVVENDTSTMLRQVGLNNFPNPPVYPQ